MQKKIVILSTLIFISLVILSSCRSVDLITSEHTVRVDSVAVPVMTPGHKTMTSFALGDSLLFEDDRLRLRIVPVFADSVPNDVTGNADTVTVDADRADSPPRVPTGYQVDAEVKPDTIEVMVPETTITERKETVRNVKVMPNWGWMVIGGLASILLVILAGAKLFGR